MEEIGEEFLEKLDQEIKVNQAEWPENYQNILADLNVMRKTATQQEMIDALVDADFDTDEYQNLEYDKGYVAGIRYSADTFNEVKAEKLT